MEVSDCRHEGIKSDEEKRALLVSDSGEEELRLLDDIITV